MASAATENCIKCKYMDCVEVCPVDCFYEGENMLVINPSECIDCGVCEPECPADAIRPDTEPAMENWVEFNRKYCEQWPVITRKKDPLPSAAEMEVEAWAAPKGSYSLSARLVKPDRPPGWRRVRMRSRRPVRILCG